MSATESSATESSATESRSAMRCTECATRLAHDQRYCLECGARRGPLPAHVSQLIGTIHERGPAAVLPAGAPLAQSLADMAEPPPQRLGFEMPGPRAAAVAVMAMLGFGVIVGSLAGGTSIGTLARAPLIVVGAGGSTPSRSANQSAATAQTVIETQIEGSGGSAAPAAAPPASTSQAPAQASAAPSLSPAPPAAGANPSPTSGGVGGLPPVKHVFVIVLSDRGFSQSFGGSGGYLTGPLRRRGELVQNYYAVAAAPLANEIALVSGQGPTEQTASDCPVFSRISSGRKVGPGQVVGTGCAYPPATKTLAGQLTTAGHTWKTYVAGIPSSVRTACRVPKPGSTQPQLAGAHTAYLAWRNPFLYFRSLTAGQACRQNEVGLGRLAQDLKSDTTTPSLAYIIPAPCADGSEVPCQPGATTGLGAADRFLKSVVPEITRSAAYKDAGLIAITFDQAPQTGPYADPSACCGVASYPNLRSLPAGTPAVPPAAMGTSSPTSSTGATTTSSTGATTTSSTGTSSASTTTETSGTLTTDTTTATGSTPTTTPAPSLGVGATTPTGGGGQVGLLLISPYVKPGSIDVVDYFNHFSLLASIENLFGLKHLGYAGAPGLPVFGAAVFNKYAG
ncbi:MAG: hypothetical protein JOY89_20675 [Solirubrobacterales bacterium]|nr:hypothetical protein [Solirubrobacterales bacterium]